MGLAKNVKDILEEHGCPVSVYAPLANLLKENTKAMRKFVIAHSGLSGSCSGMFAASTKRRTSSTEARLAFAVLTRERNAA